MHSVKQHEHTIQRCNSTGDENKPEKRGRRRKYRSLEAISRQGLLSDGSRRLRFGRSLGLFTHLVVYMCFYKEKV